MMCLKTFQNIPLLFLSNLLHEIHNLFGISHCQMSFQHSLAFQQLHNVCSAEFSSKVVDLNVNCKIFECYKTKQTFWIYAIPQRSEKSNLINQNLFNGRTYTHSCDRKANSKVNEHYQNVLMSLRHQVSKAYCC